MVLEIVDIITNVGFPIAAFLLMYRLYVKTLEDLSESIDKLSEHINHSHNNQQRIMDRLERIK